LRFGTPWRVRRIGRRVHDDLTLHRLDARAGRAQLGFPAGPRDVDRLQVPLVGARFRDGRDVSRFVVLRAAHPAEAITRLVYHDAADGVKPRGFVRGANQRLVAEAQRSKRAIEPDELLLFAPAFGDVLNAAANDRHSSAAVALRLAAAGHEPDLAVGADQLQLEGEG